jgi:signal transduction histidine kinase
MFLDIGLPGVDGIEVLRRIKEKDPAVRVLMITGQTEDEMMRQARILGADDYITKPFTLDYLNGEVMNKLHKQLFFELKAASTDLALEREKLETLFHQMQEGVILLDRSGVLLMINPFAQQILGLPAESANITLKQLLSKFTYEPGDLLDKIASHKGEPFDLTRAEPKRLVLEARINTIASARMEHFGYMVLLRDVTEQRRAETSMHRFISKISHKLRTPLVAIKGYPSLLRDEQRSGKLSDFQRRALDVIEKNCLRMEEMVNELIAFSNFDKEELARSKVPLSELIEKAKKSLPDETKKHVEKISCDNSVGDVLVHVEPHLIQQAIRNILDNAFKFGATAVTISSSRNGSFVTLKFSDDGEGIPPEDHERIFERFYQVERDFSGQVPGAGLGLTVVKQVVETHGGRVWVKSEIGKGSTFFVQLPSADSN